MRLKERSIDILWNVSKLLEDKRRWVQTTLAEDANGSPVFPQDETAVRWSLVGALSRYETTTLAVNALIQVSGCDLKTLELKATHSELLRFLERAIFWLNDWVDYATR